jgi:hypothetical protein
MKDIKIRLSPDAEKVYEYLLSKAVNSKQENMILRSLLKKIEIIKQDAHYGKPIAKKLIPQEYKIKYNINRLFRVELPCFWRMLYTIEEGEPEIEIIAFVLDIIDHKKYNKKFGYK